MEKIIRFLIQTNILTKDECDSLVKISTISITPPTDSLNKIKITLSLDKPLEFGLYKKIKSKEEEFKDQLVFEIKPKHDLDFDEEALKKYLKFFCEEKIQASSILKQLLPMIPFYTDDKGTLIFQYFNKNELEELKKHEVLLKDFFNSIGLMCKTFDYELDKDRQNLEINKEKRRQELINYQKKHSPAIQSQAEIDNKITSKAIPIGELVPELRNATIYGKIFAIEAITTKNNKRFFVYSITDCENSINIKGFETVSNNFYKKVNLPYNYLASFKVGDWIKAKITLSIDKYQYNELTGTIDKICLAEPDLDKVPEDKEPIKRVELLAHTKMSAFDGLASASELVARSRKYKWPAISIIDRYNVQSFPDAMGAAKKFNQKVIYGVEIDKLSRDIPCVLNPSNESISNATYVIFDLETTGLYNEYEEIIEFGAVKIKNGVKVDEIDRFIKPGKPIPAKIVELTRITDQMLEDAKSFKQVFKEILPWIGDAVLIAHNGINFDFRFLNKKLVENGFEPLKNVMIDTLQISRAINKELYRHTLGAICRKNKIEYTDEIAHRADFDAMVLASVWNIFQRLLRNQNITTIDKINTIQCPELYSRQFTSFANLYVKDQQGIKELYRIVSNSFTTNLLNTPRVFVDEIETARQHLIVTNSPTEGDVWDAALNGLPEDLEKAIDYYDYIFVAPPNNLLHEIQNENISLKNVKDTIKRIIATAKKLNKKVIAVSDAHYLDKQDQLAYKVYVNSKLLEGKRHRFYKYAETTTEIVPDLHLRTTKEMLDEFDFLGDPNLIKEIVIDNSLEFANKIPNDIKPLKSSLCPPNIPDADEKLQKIVWENAKKIYGNNLPKEIEERINKEFKGIIDNGYGIIYWISHLLVKKSLDDGYLVGSRGSVGSSLVAYLSNISEVNPLPPHYICPNCKEYILNTNTDDGFDLQPKLCPKCGKPLVINGHNIPFETFLGFHGEKVPDIDLNFSGEYQPNAHNFVKEMFGEHHTFRAGTIATVAQKTAYGYVKNYYETLNPDCQPNQAQINWVVSKCVDVKRTTGQHPGGIIIVPKEMDIFDFSPYNYPADDKTQNWYTTHFAFESLHDNLLKFDILGHDDPTTLRMLQNITNINPKDIPVQDEQVMKLFSSLDSLHIDSNDFLNIKVGSVGLPEFGTEFVRQMLVTAKPQSFADLIRISGLSHGTDVWLNNAANLISNMNMTLSDVITCRDDIMLTLIKLGIEPSVAFNVMESVRKGKGIKQEYIDILKKGNVPQWYIDSCMKIKYLFPKAHATAYVLMAWRIAWFKVHYPLAFYAAYFSIRCENFDIETICQGPEVIKAKIADIKRKLNDKFLKSTVKQKDIDMISVYEVALELYLRGFNIKKPDIDKSKAKEFVIDGKTLIVSFNKIPQLGNVAAHSIEEERTKKPFVSKEDLYNRTKISKSILEWMINVGMLDGLNDDDQLSLF